MTEKLGSLIKKIYYTVERNNSNVTNIIIYDRIGLESYDNNHHPVINHFTMIEVSFSENIDILELFKVFEIYNTFDMSHMSRQYRQRIPEKYL